MRATVMYGANDVRVENVPDARLIEPTDALVRMTRACICGSDLWPYNSMAPSATGNWMGALDAECCSPLSREISGSTTYAVEVRYCDLAGSVSY
ncbi:MAG: hypothetical protein Q7J25_06380 [Vicinamibacterales bacterium]|nr:hypothetical protein [Vicinamibacterales bacterium]